MYIENIIPMNLQLFGNGDTGTSSVSTGGNAAATSTTSTFMSGSFDGSDEISLVGENEGSEAAEAVEADPKESIAASPADSKQDPKIDSAFAKLRKEKETFEKTKKELDSWVNENFGKQYGIKTIEEYKEMLDRQLREEKEAEFREAGYDPEVIKEIIKSDPKLAKALNMVEAQEQDPAAAQAEYDKKLVDDYKVLAEKFQGLVTKPEDIPPQVWELYDKGLDLVQAYAAVNYEAIANHNKTVGSQQALNKINSKAHLKVEADGQGEVNDVFMPQETLAMYLDMGMSRKEAFAHYKKLYK